MWENAYLSIKNPKASRALKRALDPGRKLLASLAWLRFTTSATFGLSTWGPPLDQILDPHLVIMKLENENGLASSLRKFTWAEVKIIIGYINRQCLNSSERIATILRKRWIWFFSSVLFDMFPQRNYQTLERLFPKFDLLVINILAYEDNIETRIRIRMSQRWIECNSFTFYLTTCWMLN